MSIETPEAATRRVTITDERPGRGRAQVVEGITEASENADADSEDQGHEQDDDADEQHDTDGEESGGGESGGDDEGAEQGASGEEGADEDHAGDGEDKPAEPKAAKEPWHIKRIGKLTKEKADALAELKARDEKIAALEAAQGGGEDAPKLYTQSEVNALVERGASARSEQTLLNEKLDGIFDKAVVTYKDFPQKVEAWNNAFGPDLAQRGDFFAAVADLPNADAVLHSLGGNIDRMGEILDMAPAKMGIALANLSTELAKPKAKAISKLAAPIKPLESTTKAAKDIWDPKISDEEYVRLRREQRAAKQAQGR